MAKKFLTDINIAGGVYDSSGDIGSSGQVLSSTGSGINWIDATSSASVVYQDGFTGDGSATAFTLANSIDNENKTQVYIDGVYQHKDNYSLSGTTLTFSTAPPNSSDIEVISFSSVSSADDILYDDDFASAGLMTTNGSGVYSITTNNSSNWNTAYTYSQVGHLPLSGGAITGAITTNSTFDGRDISVDGTKLDGIEANATADQTDAEIRAAVEAATDSNVFTDADHSKLNGIEASADVTDTTNVTAAGALMDSEVTNLADVKAFDTTDYATAAQGVKADSAQQPPSEGAFVNGDKTKLDGIAAGAEVNVQSDWNSTSGDSLILNKPSIPSITGLASETYVDTAVSNLVDSAPGTLDTLNELAAALGDDANFSTTVTNSIATKMPLAGGTFTGDITIGGKTYPKLNLTDNQGVARNFSVGTNNETFTVRNETAGSDALTISNANNATFAGTITASGGNSGNWNTAYTYSQVGHLPLAGGTLTGALQAQSWLFRSMAQQVEYHVLDNGSINGPSWKFRYDGVTANRYVDFGYKDGNGTYTAGLKLYNNQTISWRGTDIINSSSQWIGGIASSGYNNSNWDTAYTYSQVGHLPLAGGTLTGGLIGTTATFSGDARFNERVRIGDVTGLSNRGTVRIDTRGDAPADLLFGRDTAGTATGWNGVYWAISSRNSGQGNKFTIYRGSGHSSPYNSEAIPFQIEPNLNATFAGTITASGSIVAGTSPDTTPAGTAFSHTLASVNGSSRVVNFEGASSSISTWYTIGNVAYGAIDQSASYMSFWQNLGLGWQEQFRIYRGYQESLNSLRAPLFYDSDNTGYYTNPAGESKIVKLWINNGGASGVGWSTGFNQGSGSNYWNQIQDASVARQRNFGGGGYDWYSSGGTELMDLSNSGSLFAAANMKAPIFYDSSNTAYYAYPTSQSVFYRLKLQGTGTANAAALEIDNPSTSTFMHTGELFTPNMTAGQTNIFVIGKEGTTKQSGYIGYNWAASGSNNNYVSIGHWSADHLFRVYGDVITTTVGIRSDADVRGTIFYDKNNTAYYAHLDSTATSVKIAGGIESNAANGNVIIKHTVSEANSWLFQENATNWGLFWMNEPISGTAFGGYTTVGAEFIGFRNGSATNFISPSSYAGIDTNAYAGWLLSNYNGYFWTAGTQYSAVDMRAPIFYDSNNTNYFYHGDNSASLAGTMNIWGGTGGNYGNQLILGQQSISAAYTLQDSNARPLIYMTGQYPALTLNHTVTTNTNHGPTVQYTHNGLSNRQWVHGSSGDGEHFFFGYSDSALINSNHNPHNGIAGYQGISVMTFKNNGYVGIGGDWGGLGGGDPLYAIDTRGTLYNNTDVRAPIFYDSNDTAYYVNPATSSLLKGVQINTTASSPGASLKIYSTTNHQYPQIHSNASLEAMWNYKNTAAEWYVGIRTSSQLVGASGFHFYNTTSAQTVGGWDINGHSYSISSSRAPIFYDSNDTNYYVDPTSGSRLLRLGLNVAPDLGVAGDVLKIQGGNNGLGCIKAISGSMSYGVRIEGSNLSTQLALYTSSTSQTTQINFEVAGNGSAGKITTTTNTTTYTTSSDYRLKENVVPMSNSISRLNQLKPNRFNFIGEPDRTVDGFLAHEVQEIVPEAVIGEKDAVDEDGNIVSQGIDQAKLVPLLVAAIQELEARVKELENN